MQYNKNKFNKIKDKKVLHKVKRQWVTISLSMLAMLGAAGVAIYDPNYAHADTTNTTNSKINTVQEEHGSNEDASSSVHQDQSQSDTNEQKQNNTSVNNEKNNIQQPKTDVHIKDNQKTQVQNNNQSSQQAGHTNKFQSVNSRMVTTPQINESEQKGFDSGLNGNNDPTNDNSSYKDGYNLYNKYQQSISDGVNNRNNSQASDANSDQYYNAAKSGYNDAQNQYNTDTENQGTSYDGYSNYSGNTDDSSHAWNDTRKYNNDNISKLDSYKNSSINLKDNGQVVIESNVSKEKLNQYYNPILQDVYKYGSNYFFANQATKDAKSGKWQGTNYDHGTYNSNTQLTSTKDFYDSFINNDSGNYNNDPYYQSYEGAKQAILNQYDFNGNYIGLKNDINNNNQYYDDSYNNVVQDSQNGIAYANNAKQFNQIITGYNNSTGYTTSAINSSASSSGKLVNDIRLVNDINLADVSTGNSGETGTSPVLNTNITLNGQNHLADFRGFSYSFNNSSSSSSVSVKNFKTLYGQNYWGPISSSKGVINFDNINYVGPQMLQSTNNDVYISGNVNDFQDFPTNIGANSFSEYVSPFSNGEVGTDGDNQQGLYVNNLTLAPNANFFSATSAGTGGPNIELEGNLTLGNKAHMNLLARNSGGDGNSNNASIGLSSNAKLSIANSSQLNIVLDTVSGSSQYANAISANNSTVSIDGGQLNVSDNGSSYDSSELLSFGNSTLDITNNGSLNLRVKNMNSGSDGNSGLLDASGSTINIANGQMLIDASDASNSGNGSNSFYLINGNVNVINPGNDGVVLKKNNNIKYLYSGSTLNSETSSVNNNLYYKYQLNSDNTVNYIDASGNRNPSNYSINSDQSNTLGIYQAPGVYVVGPVSGSYDATNHTATMTGLLKVTEKDVLKSDDGIYFHGYTSNQNNTNNTNNTNQKGYDDYSGYDNRLNPSDADANGFIKFTETIKNVNTKPDIIGANVKYGIQGLNIVVNGDNYDTQTINAQNYIPDNQSHMVASNNPVQLSTNNNSDITNAINAALNDVDNPNNLQKNIDKYNKDTNKYTDNYDSTIKGYKAYDPNSQVTNPDAYKKANGYTDAYDNGTGDAFAKGYQQAQQDALINGENSGANDYINGISEDTTAHPSGSYYDKGYQSAKTGYLDGLTTNTTNQNNRNSSQSTTGYDIGNNAGVKEYNNYVNAENNPNTASTQSTVEGVSNAIKSVNNAMNNHDGNADDINNLPENSDSNLKYQAAYNAALSSAKSNNNNGINTVINGKEPDTTNMTTANADIYNHAYKDAQKGFQEGLSDNSLSTSQMTPDEKAAFDKSNQYQSGFQTAFKDYPNVQQNNESIAGYQDAIKGMQAADNHSDQSIGLSGIDLTIYNAAKAQKQGQMAATKAAQNSNQNNNGAAINGIDTSNSDAQNSSSATSYVDGYNSVKDGYNDGLANKLQNNQSSNDAYTSGYNQGNAIGQTARGAKDYLAGQQANAHPVNKDNYDQGYNNAKAGYVNGMTGQQTTGHNVNTNSAEYRNAQTQGQKAKGDYNDAEQESDSSKYNGNKQGTYSGVTDAINAVKNAEGNQQKIATPNGNAAYNLAYNQAVQDAQAHDGANDFVQGKAKQTSLTPANQSVYDKAYADAKGGYNEALDGQPTQNDSENQNETTGFNAGKNAESSYDEAIKAYENASDKSSVSDVNNQVAKPDAYKDTIDALKAADTNTVDTNNNKPTYVVTSSQELGLQKALSVLNTTPLPNNPSDDGSQYADSSSAQDKASFEKTYQNVIDGYKAGYENPDASSNPNSGLNQYAYSEGLAAGKQAIGAYDYLNSKDTSNQNADYQTGVKNAQTGYNDGITDTKTSGADINSPEYQEGKNVGANAKSDYNKAEQEANPSADQSNYNNNKKGTYSGVADAINAMKNAKGNSALVLPPNGDAAYNLAYNQAVKEAQHYNGADDFINGNNKPTNLTPANQSVYDAAYAEAQTGYNEALNDPTTSSSTMNANELEGFNAGLKAEKSYNAAIKAYDAATNKSDVSDQTNQSGIDADSYKNTIDALKAADINQTDIHNHNPIYVVANSQELGRQKALDIINQSPRPTNPSDDGSQDADNSIAQDKGEFEKAYQNVIDGYNAGVTNNPDIKENGNDNLNKDSFNAGQAAGNQVRGANDYLSGKDTTKDNNNDYQTGVKNAQTGYNDGITDKTTPDADTNSPEYKIGQKDGKNDQNNYNKGITQALNTYDPKQNDSNAQTLNHGAEQDAYNGAAAAIQAVKNADGNNSNIKPVNGQSPAYLKAYNDTLNKAEADAKAGQNNFLNGQNKNNGTDALSGVAADAYDHTQAGFQSALNGGSEPADDINEKAGFDQAKAIKQGYNQAVTDYNQGNKDPNAHSDMAGYQETMNGLIDGAKDTPTDNQPANNKSLYEAARAQSMGTKNGITDAVDNNADANAKTPNGVNDAIYQKAYQAAKAGYNNQKDAKSSDVIYNNAYEQGAQQKGANDYVTGKANDDTANEDNLSSNDEYIRNHAQGVKDAKDAYNGQLNNHSNASITGENAATNANAGYTDAQNDHQPVANAPQAEKDAYWGAQSGANTGKQQPEDINSSSRAYQAAKARAEKVASSGAEQYLSDKFNNRNLEPSGNDELYKQGYNNQKAYDNGFSNPNGQTPNYNNQGQINAYAAGKNDGAKTSSYNAAANGDKQDNDASYKGAQQGFADAQNGDALNPSNNMSYNNPKDILKYQSAYAKAYGEASNEMSQGARQYGSDANTDNPNVPSAKSNSGVTNQDTKSFNQGYNNQRAYEDGLNNPTNHSNSYANNSPEQKAYQAGRAASQAVANASQDAADGANRTQANQNAQDTYDGSKAGYADGADGSQYTSNLDKTPDYQMAYNNAYNNMQKDRKAGANGFFNQNANDFNDLNKINQAKPDASHNDNNMDNRAYNNGFAEQQGYAAGLINKSANNPYAADADKGPTSRYAAYAKGLTDSKAGYEAAQNESDPDNNKMPANIVDEPSKEAYQAAVAAYQDVKKGLKPTDNTAKSDSYQMAYNMAYNTDQAAKVQGENSFINPGTDNNDNHLSNAASALYKQGNVDAENGYNTIMNPSQAPINGGSDNNSAEYQAGMNLAKNILSGVQAAAKGDKSAPSADQNVVNGFNTANEAIKNAVNDAENGKNQANGKLNPSAIQVPSDISPADQKAYIDVYQGAYNGYNNGLNGGSQNPTASQDSNYNDMAYKAAYDNAFKQGQNDIPAPALPAPKSDDSAAGKKAGQKAFINGIPLNIHKIDLSGKSQSFIKAFKQAYDQTQRGFNAAVKGHKDESKNPSYKAGYQAAKDYQKGLHDAKSGKKLAKNSNDAYRIGYEAFKNGRSGRKINMKLLGKLDASYRKAYQRDFNIGHKDYVDETNKATRAGEKRAASNNHLPSFKHESKAYKEDYMKGFNEEVRKNLPHYVYNLRKIYSHSKAALTRKTRVKKYNKTPRYDRHVFRVQGYKITPSGQVVYKVKGLGWINANDKSVANVYYRRHDTKKPIQKVRVIKPEGTYIYNSKHFDAKHAVRKVQKGETVKVQRIEKLGGITRFYIGDGKYISSNKTIVEHLR
ncbi:DUF5776 domain-containing protein [Apilactobacillus micheneri]|uniref:DUF5776 domain-containing protein n=1 Tax=Apilactobacillus micheneri TaxID=1899430 RepID=UPI000D0374F3|nr:DUF5776 domain-containing protein [Apilactobacillus micheneri]TPR37955.1 hypothetical protein DY116_01675 [Apilactobacillus micheneri]